MQQIFKARRARRIADNEERYVFQFRIQHRKGALLIGKEGQIIRELKAKYGCCIDTDTDLEDRTLLIVGIRGSITLERSEELQKEIFKIIDEKPPIKAAIKDAITEKSQSFTSRVFRGCSQSAPRVRAANQVENLTSSENPAPGDTVLTDTSGRVFNFFGPMKKAVNVTAVVPSPFVDVSTILGTNTTVEASSAFPETSFIKDSEELTNSTHQFSIYDDPFFPRRPANQRVVENNSEVEIIDFTPKPKGLRATQAVICDNNAYDWTPKRHLKEPLPEISTVSGQPNDVCHAASASSIYAIENGLPRSGDSHAAVDFTGSLNQPTFTFADIRNNLERCDEASTSRWNNFPPLRKNFYVEHPEVTKMSDNEASRYRFRLNNIKVCCDNSEQSTSVLKPCTKFEHAFHNYPEILNEIRKQGFTVPTPIQAQVWPLALSGFDVIGIAQTGTGKTLAFLLPAFIHIDHAKQSKPNSGPTCLVLSPTRELALQIESEVKKYSYHGIKSVCIYGGGSRKDQVNICVKGVDIIIATPGRLNDLVMAGHINVESVSFLVLDEADRMLDMGFQPQIFKILLDVRPDRHTIMTSATWPPLVREVGTQYTTEPVLVFVGTLNLAAVHTVTQRVTVLAEGEKREWLYNFLRDILPTDKVIVFVAQKSLADDLASDLTLAGFDCQSMHGDRVQCEREQALDDIKTGRVKILVATDLAARGLDILDITHVFNYDFPRNIEEYVHRVGRTGRAGRRGTSITLMTRSDWCHATELIKILEEANAQVPWDLRKMADRYRYNTQQKHYSSSNYVHNSERYNNNNSYNRRNYTNSNNSDYSNPFSGFKPREIYNKRSTFR